MKYPWSQIDLFDAQSEIKVLRIPSTHLVQVIRCFRDFSYEEFQVLTFLRGAPSSLESGRKINGAGSRGRAKTAIKPVHIDRMYKTAGLSQL